MKKLLFTILFLLSGVSYADITITGLANDNLGNGVGTGITVTTARKVLAAANKISRGLINVIIGWL